MLSCYSIMICHLYVIFLCSRRVNLYILLRLRYKIKCTITPHFFQTSAELIDANFLEVFTRAESRRQTGVTLPQAVHTQAVRSIYSPTPLPDKVWWFCWCSKTLFAGFTATHTVSSVLLRVWWNSLKKKCTIIVHCTVSINQKDLPRRRLSWKWK